MRHVYPLFEGSPDELPGARRHATAARPLRRLWRGSPRPLLSARDAGWPAASQVPRPRGERDRIGVIAGSRLFRTLHEGRRPIRPVRVVPRTPRIAASGLLARGRDLLNGAAAWPGERSASAAMRWHQVVEMAAGHKVAAVDASTGLSVIGRMDPSDPCSRHVHGTHRVALSSSPGAFSPEARAPSSAGAATWPRSAVRRRCRSGCRRPSP